MSNVAEPCQKCGGTDWYSDGHCRPCNKAWRDANAARKKASPVPCAKCGQIDLLANGKCRPCRNNSERARAAAKIAGGAPCPTCGGTNRRVDGTCKTCRLRQHQERCARKIAASAPCAKCGGVEMLSSGACKACWNEWRRKKGASGDPCRACGGTSRWASGQCRTCGTDRRTKKKYGLDARGIEALRASQGGKCGICRCQLSDLHSTKVHVDHDHDTGIVRGVLCNDCNIAIGFLRDSPSRAMRAAAYLRRHTPPLPFDRKGAA